MCGACWLVGWGWRLLVGVFDWRGSEAVGLDRV